MNQCEEQYRVLISGYLDGELAPAEQAELEAHLETCPDCRRELEVMRRLFRGTSSAFAASDIPDETWDRFLDAVYNRIERRTGWIVLILGAVCLALFGVYVFVMEPWTSALLKTLLAAPVAGLAILFISVLRQRLASIKTDRYTKEVHR